MIKGDLEFRYTAISHVWAGGLGNEYYNSLPSCQLRSLWHMIQELPDLRPIDVERIGLTRNDNRQQRLAKIVESFWNRVWGRDKLYLWLDTLCIPMGHAFKAERKMAIKTMSQIYAGAESVLVLDPHLQQLQEINPSSDFFQMQLLISPWMARSWPLQEGALASNLCVRLKNETIVRTRSQQKDLLSLSLHLTNSVSESRVRQNPDFHTVWNALASRSTKQPDDLPGIFAAILNLSAGQVLRLESFDQMKAIIARQKVIPFTLMCRPCAQMRIEAGKNTWMPLFPRSSSEAGKLNHLYGTLKVSEQGLKFEKSQDTLSLGMIVEERVDFSTNLFLRDSNHESCYEIVWGCKVKSHQERASPRRMLFMMTHEPSSSSRKYRGCCFGILKKTENGMNVIFVHSFTWSSVHMQIDEALIVQGLRFDQLDKPDYDLLINEDIKAWPHLDWFRLEKFPFIGISGFQEDYSQSKSFAAALLTSLACAIPIIRLITLDDAFGLNPIDDPYTSLRWKDHINELARSGVDLNVLNHMAWSEVLQTLKELNATYGNLSPLIEAFKLEPSETRKPVIIVLGAYWMWLVARFYYFEFETVFWKMWLARLVQQRWAATFFDESEKAKSLLNNPEPTKFFQTLTHAPLYIIACMVLIWSAFVESAPQREILYWIAAILTIEPAVGLLVSGVIHNMQDIIRRGHADPLPPRTMASITILLAPGMAYLLWQLRVLFWEIEVTDTKVSIAFYAAAYGILVSVLSVAWLSGVLSYAVWSWQQWHRKEPLRSSAGRSEENVLTEKKSLSTRKEMRRKEKRPSTNSKNGNISSTKRRSSRF